MEYTWVGPFWGVCLVMQDLFGAVDLVTEEQSSTAWLRSSVTVNRWSLASGASLYSTFGPRVWKERAFMVPVVLIQHHILCF